MGSVELRGRNAGELQGQDVQVKTRRSKWYCSDGIGVEEPAVIKTLMQRLKISEAAVAEPGYQYLQRDLDLNFYPQVELQTCNVL